MSAVSELVSSFVVYRTAKITRYYCAAAAQDKDSEFTDLMACMLS